MSGRVTIVVLDNGATAIQVPVNSTQLVIGTSSVGTVAAPFASTSPQNINTQFGWGPMPEAAAMIAAAGGVPICVRVTSNGAGAASSVTTGAGNTSTSVVTVTGTPLDTYYVIVSVALGGTIATGPCNIQISLDAGRTISPVIQLGTGNSYAIPNTGVTLNFAAGTLVTGDTFTFGTTEPTWNDAGVQACINAFLASQYKQQGIGSIHIVGGSSAANFSVGAAGSDMTTIGGYLQSMRQNQYVFSRAILSARDAKPAAKWGGTGETEAAWMTALNADFPAQSLNADTTGRISVGAGNWNMTSQFTNGLGLSPRFRRNVAWAMAQRLVTIPPQRMPSRVRDGALSSISISVQDKSDGFVYHDESITPGLDTNTGGGGGKFATTTTIQGQAGVFLEHGNLMSPVGSVIGFWPQGAVLDIACSIAYQIGVLNIDDDVRTTPLGTIDPRDATTIQDAIQRAIKVNMTDHGMLVASAANPFGCLVTVDQQHILNTLQGGDGNLPIQVQIFGKGYILTETITVGFAPAAAA